MASFEESARTRLSLAQSSGEPPPTDLEYYAKPENYTGATMSLQQFMFSTHKNVPTGRESPASGQKTNAVPIGAPHAGNFVDKDPDDDVKTVRTERDQIRSRRGSVKISSRRGSIQLEIKSIRKISSSDLERPNFEKDRRISVSRQESMQSDTPVPQPEVRWQEAVDRVGKVGVSVPHASKPKSQLTEEEQTKWARDRFRHAIKTVVILLKWISSLTEKEEAEEQQKEPARTFTDIASEAFASGELKDSGLSFDVSQFKANREINISNEVKSILSIPSHTRSTEQLQTALYGLQHLKSFAEYPLHMQEKLCKVAWFQQVPPKRIIIRQGHYAENFYFILSGQALVRILEKHPKTGEPQLRTATIMRKGTSFGELALLHHSRRTATVVSQDTIQLLTIGRDDFFDIFMGGNAPGEIPEHIKFCSSLDFMQDWPIGKLLENPQYCLFHFFKRGVVIVKDSNQSEWLYIIKSGSCQVMKELKGVTPRLGGTDVLRHTANSATIPASMSDKGGPKVDTGLRRPITRARIGRTPTPVQDARLQYQLYSEKPEKRSKDSQLDAGSSPQPGISPSRYPSIRRAHFKKPKNESPFLTTRTFDSKHSPSGNTPRMSPIPLDRVREDRHFVNEVALKGPVFVQVEVLKPKDVFGLTTIMFDDDIAQQRTSVSLVSNGAECIMFSKKFFMQHADELVKKMIRYQVRHYPTEKTLQENLQTKVDWDLYKRRLIRDTILSNKYSNRPHSVAIL